MKTLSVTQPYATLLCSGVKTIEQRSWSTEYRGMLLIHATKWSAKLFDPIVDLRFFQEYDKCIAKNGDQVKESKILSVVDNRLILLDDSFRREYALLKTEIAKQADKGLTLFPMHSIVGKVDIIDVVSNGIGYDWIVDNAVLFNNPVHGVKGKLRLWDFQGSFDSRAVDYVVE